MHRTKLFGFILIVLLGAGLAALLGIISPKPSPAVVVPLSLASGPTPFAPGCGNAGVPQVGTLYPNAEVEPWVAINPVNSQNIIGVWQQDRWSNGGANSLLTGVTYDGGKTWKRVAPAFSRCAGGSPKFFNDYERASDPWVTFSPNGVAHQISLPFNQDVNAINGVTVSRSNDGGSTWTTPITLIRDTDPRFFNDKESITADPRDSRFVYAIWDRLETLNSNDDFRGPTIFTRTTDGGSTWEPARVIYDPGINSQTIGNQIVVTPKGTLVNVFTLFIDTESDEGKPDTNSSSTKPNESVNPGIYVAVNRSNDKGVTWSQPTIISTLESIGVVDPETQKPLRTGDIIPDIAVNPNTGALYVVWQDARFSGGKRDGIVLSRSLDNGLTWSRPTRVNSVPQVQAFTAAVDVTSNGTVGVTYYDFRNNTSNPNTLPTNYWLATSRNGGRTWSETSLAAPFDMTTAPVARGYFVGDYEGLAHIGSSFVSLFVQANSGNTSNRTDVFDTSISGVSRSVENTESLANTAKKEDINLHPLGRRTLLRSHQR